jgi:hypothetical protein
LTAETRSGTVLLVDDDSSALESYGRMLRLEG